jgi:hypothetical protein
MRYRSPVKMVVDKKIVLGKKGTKEEKRQLGSLTKK